MTNLEGGSRIHELLRAHVARAREIPPEARLREDLGLDSLAILELVAEAEARWQVTVSYEALNHLATVADLDRALGSGATPPARPPGRSEHP